MGGGCACNYYLKKNYILSPGSNIPLENRMEHINRNIMPNKSNLMLSNILGSNNESDRNKRYSDIHNYEKKNFEKYLNIKNNGIKINDGKNTSCNETNNKKISSNFNSSNFYGSNIYPANSKKNNEVIEEEENINIEKKKINKANNLNPINEHNKHNSIMNKIKKKEDGLKKAETNINCNLGDSNYIFINISRGSSLINNDEIDNFESTTPKMFLEKENLDELFKGNKKLFSHFCKKNLNDKGIKKVTNKSVFIHTFDMNKYNEENLYFINKIRTNPESFIKDIDYLLCNNIKETEEGIFLVSHDVDEKIKLMDNYLIIFEKVKKFLKEMADSQNKMGKLEKMKYNDELEIIFDESAYEENEDDNENDIQNMPIKLNDIYKDNGIDMGDDEEKNLTKYNDNINIIDYDNDIEKENKILKDFKIKKSKKVKKKKGNINKILDLNDDKIANLILQKRKEIKDDYPYNIFKMTVIKDIKINILIQIGLEEFCPKENNDNDDNKNTLKEIIFNPKYKNFGISWTNEINRNFVSIACFA